jgi:hypothetical protein
MASLQAPLLTTTSRETACRRSRVRGNGDNSFCIPTLATDEFTSHCESHSGARMEETIPQTPPRQPGFVLNDRILLATQQCAVVLVKVRVGLTSPTSSDLTSLVPSDPARREWTPGRNGFASTRAPNRRGEPASDLLGTLAERPIPLRTSPRAFRRVDRSRTARGASSERLA